MKKTISVTVSLCLAFNIVQLLLSQAEANEPTKLNINLDGVTNEIDLTLGGWARIDYGIGNDRYGREKGGDRLGVSQYALVTSVQFNEDISFVGVVGGTVFSEGSSESFEIRDAFMVWDYFLAVEGLTLNAGAQPILFGLKPNGYPNDHSLQPSVEYGAAGFAVSQQAGPSVYLTQKIYFMEDAGLMGKIKIGAFDHDEENTMGNDGSSLDKNYFVELKIDQLFLEGLYGVVGFEKRYTGADIDSSEPIFDVGLGFTNDLFDISFEYIDIDRDLINPALTDDEQYLVGELTIKPREDLSIYADWAKAEETDVETTRIGVSFDHESWLNYKLEVSRDDIRNGEDPESVDFRVTLSF